MPIKPDDLNRNKNGNGNNQDKDDFVSSSFAVQFKPGDKASSVSDKLKGNPKEVEDEFDSFKDEFDDFVFDESVSAFKPIDSEEAVKSAFVPRGGVAPKEVNVKPDTSDEKKGADIPAFPKNGGTFDRKPSDDVSKGPDKSNTPVFGSEAGGSKVSAADQKKDEKLFSSGNSLDFATSEHDKNKSDFANAKRPGAPVPDEVNTPKAEKKPEVKTYGTVSSGVNAFGAKPANNKPEAAKESGNGPSPFVIRPTPSPKPAMPKAPEAKQPVKPEAPHTAPAAAKAQEEKPAHVAPAAAKAQEEKPAHIAPAAAKAQNEKAAHVAPAAAKAQSEKATHVAPAAAKAQNEKPAHVAPAAAKAQNEKAAPAAAKEDTSAAKRPGEAAKANMPVLSKPAPKGSAIESIRPDDARRTLAVEKSQNAVPSTPHEKPNISPVDTVKKTRKKKTSKAAKDPGIGGIITLAVIIVAFIGILLILQNLDKIGSVFGRKPVETLPTITTKTTVTETTEATTTEATTESTTDATTESTTEATTESTTEATTTTTTAATTTTEETEGTTAKKDTGIATKNFKTKITNFRGTSNGFKFDVVLINNASKTASLKKSLKSVSVTLVSSNTIKSVSCGYFKFKKKNGAWVGTPIDYAMRSGSKLTATVTVKTSGKPSFFAYTKSSFNFN